MAKNYSDATKLFDALRQKVESQSQTSTGSFGNPNILKLKRGNSYKLRLLWVVPPDGIDREFPMLNQYVHRIWDDDAIGSKNVEVYCKTSQYDEGDTKAGFACPICKKMSEMYKEYSEKGSASAKEIYNKFRRTLHGYVPVYVISGPTEDLHKVKILQYTKTFKDFFDEKIFGVKKLKKNDEQENPTEGDGEIIGIDAFTYYDPKENTVITKAYDFTVSVLTKRVPVDGKMIDMPDYKLDFTRKMSEIDFDGEEITVEKYLGLSDELGFDCDFFKKSTTEELERFKAKYITAESEIDVPIEEEVEEDKVSTMIPKKKPEVKVESTKVVEKVESKEEISTDELDSLVEDNGKEETSTPEKENTSEGDDDIDIDDLLKDI